MASSFSKFSLTGAKAANGEFCQIPFSDAGVEYYHCRNTSPECKTQSGSFAKCANGRFHYAKAGTTFNPFVAEYLFPTVSLPEPGDYVARFYIMMLCNKEGCEQAQDFISFTVNDASSVSIVYKEFLLKDLEMEKKWIQKEVKFKTTAKDVNVSLNSSSLEMLNEEWRNRKLVVLLDGILFGKKSKLWHSKLHGF